MNQIDLRDAVAVITGGAGGLGQAVAARMVASGARVVSWDRTVSPDAPASTSLQLPVDVTDEDQVAEALARTLAACGRLDILVNAAGLGNHRARVEDYPVEAFRRILDVNVVGTFLACKHVLPAMRAANRGRIVNIASVAGRNGNPFASAYAASKAAVIAFTRSLANELASTEVRANCIVPSAIEAGLFDSMGEEARRGSLQRIPMGRFGRPDELAAMVCWLASEDCSFSNGAAFDLSGGAAL